MRNCLTLNFAFAKVMRMELTDYISSGRGNAARIATALGVKAAYVSQIASGHRRASPVRAVQIEELTGGVVTRAELRPDDFWRIWPDLAHD